jgi:hypothetical protein
MRPQSQGQNRERAYFLRGGVELAPRVGAEIDEPRTVPVETVGVAVRVTVRDETLGGEDLVDGGGTLIVRIRCAGLYPGVVRVEVIF